MSGPHGGMSGGAHGGGRDGEERTYSPSRGERPLLLDDLVYINRMTTVGHVLPGVAHELNNALQVIGGLVELLGMRGELPPDVHDKVQKIGIQAMRSAGMMREFVAFARRDETTTRIDVHRALEQAVNLRRFHLARARVDVITPPAPAAGSLILQADSHAVLQVLLNLIINAEESLGTKPIGERELRFRIDTDGEMVLCEVRDSGPGFGDGARASAVAPFFSTKPKGAAGLGLTVATALVEMDRGTLRIVDAPGGCVQVRWCRAF